MIRCFYHKAETVIFFILCVAHPFPLQYFGLKDMNTTSITDFLLSQRFSGVLIHFSGAGWCSVCQWAGLPPFVESHVLICRTEAARFVKLAQFHPRHRSCIGRHSKSFFLLLSRTKFKAHIRNVKLQCYESLFEFSYRAKIYKRSGLTGSIHLPTKSSVTCILNNIFFRYCRTRTVGLVFKTFVSCACIRS
jgi:hypothetical protein